MCVGTPLQIISIAGSGLAQCRDGAGEIYAGSIQTQLLDVPPCAGDWILVHIDTAIRALEPGEAQLIANALEALQRAADGEPFEHLIADLVDREPELPAHLRGVSCEHGEHITANDCHPPGKAELSA